MKHRLPRIIVEKHPNTTDPTHEEIDQAVKAFEDKGGMITQLPNSRISPKYSILTWAEKEIELRRLLKA